VDTPDLLSFQSVECNYQDPDQQLWIYTVTISPPASTPCKFQVVMQASGITVTYVPGEEDSPENPSLSAGWDNPLFGPADGNIGKIAALAAMALFMDEWVSAPDPF
jgi:hypothetical protein